MTKPVRGGERLTDPYWGDGGDGSGRNMLGQILMRVRDELRVEASVSGGGSYPNATGTDLR